MRLIFAMRLLWRDWRGGELRLLFAALVIAVTSVSGIALFTERLEKALLLESANILAADRVLVSARRPPPLILREAGLMGLRTANILSFTSMAFSDSGNMLVSAKAVSDAYPLRGDLIITDAPFTRGRPVTKGPPPGEVWLETRVLPALGLEIGDSVFVGEAELLLGHILIAEPDRQGGMIDNAGPRLMMNIADVDRTGVVQTGSRVRYRYLFASDDLSDLNRFESWLRAGYGNAYRLRDVREESEEVAEALDTAERFLLLGSLFAVLLAGVAIALSARRYSERHYDYVAILKTFGCTSADVAMIYLSIQAVLALAAVTLGCLLGWLLHEGVLSLLQSMLNVELPAATFRPFVIGSVTALICLLSFALPPLLALRGTPPLRVLRKDIQPRRLGGVLPYLFGAAGSIGLALWYSGDGALTALLVAALLAMALFLSALSWLLLRGGGVLGMQAGSAWMLAMTGIRRRRKQNVLQVLVFSATLMALLTLSLLRTDLIDDWQAQLPENTPNHFMMNITAEQIPGMQDFFQRNGVQDNAFYPLISARPLRVNGALPTPRYDDYEDDDDDDDDERTRGESTAARAAAVAESATAQSSAASGNAASTTANQSRTAQNRSQGRRIGRRQVTWADELPPDNRITAGAWWGADSRPGYISVEQEYADWLGLQIGDSMDFEVNRRLVSAEVSSFRSVRWDNMQPNFFIIFSPGTINHLGGTYLSTALLESEQKMLLNELVRSFPTVVIIEVDALIEQIQNIIGRVTSAVELIFALVLLCGALVLLACVNATLDERLHENAVLRTLGARRRLILSSLLIEFACIGLIAGLIATACAEASLYYLQEEIFQQDFAPHPWVWVVGPLLGTLLIAALGVNATRRVVNVGPLAVLRRIA